MVRKSKVNTYLSGLKRFLTRSIFFSYCFIFSISKKKRKNYKKKRGKTIFRRAILGLFLKFELSISHAKYFSTLENSNESKLEFELILFEIKLNVNLK